MKTKIRNMIPISAGLVLAITLSVITVACSSTSSTATSSTPTETSTSTETTAPPSSTTATSSQFQRRGASGTLAAINGDTLTLTTQQGQVTVNVSSDTTIEKTVVGTVNDLSQGDIVTISGTADSTGNVNATLIMVRPQSQQGQSPQITGNGGTFTRPNGGSTPGGNPGRQFTIGTISGINGNSLTVTTAQSQVTVNIGSDTVIQNTVSGTLSDLQTGVSLTVVGPTDSNGNVDATSISIRPQGQGFPGGIPSTTAS